ncbi:hypothetical protein ACF0H5_001144 [Mactra antiquata]
MSEGENSNDKNIPEQLKLLCDEIKSQRKEVNLLHEEVQGNAFQVTSESLRSDIDSLPEAFAASVDQLPQLLQESRADSTSIKYKNGFSRTNRSDGASVAANKGIKDRLFKRHSRWSSESAKDGYVKDNLSERLLVSQSLGL